jgi:ribonuclease HI
MSSLCTGICPCADGQSCQLETCQRIAHGLVYEQAVAATVAEYDLTKANQRSKRPEGDSTDNGNEVVECWAPTACFCACGRRCRSIADRRTHITKAALDGCCHGLPADERSRSGGCWVLADLGERTVLRAGRQRIRATGTHNEYSTKAEAQTMELALAHSLPELQGGDTVTLVTDSRATRDSFQAIIVGDLSTRRLFRKPDVTALSGIKRLVANLTDRGVTVKVEWRPAEHNVDAEMSTPNTDLAL